MKKEMRAKWQQGKNEPFCGMPLSKERAENENWMNRSDWLFHQTVRAFLRYVDDNIKAFNRPRYPLPLDHSGVRQYFWSIPKETCVLIVLPWWQTN